MSQELKKADPEIIVNQWLRRLISAAFVAGCALEIICLWWPMHWPDGTNWLDAALLILATAGTLAALARHSPLQNVLFAAAIIAIGGGAMEWLNAKMEIPFGPIVFEIAGPKIFNALPWAIPLVWIVVILNARSVARLMLRPWRKTKTYGFRLIGLTAALAAVFDFALEPFATLVKKFWFWETTKFPATWQGAPLVNFLSWAVVAILILAFITPLLINKQLSKRRGPDLSPLVIWLGGILLFGAGCTAQKIWPAAAADAVIGILTAIFAVRGAKW